MRRWSWLGAAILLVGSRTALSQSRASSPREAVVPPAELTSLESRLPLAVADRLLTSDKLDDQLRGIERLSGWGRREGVDRVLRALDAGTPLARDPRVRLTAIRALSPFVGREAVLKFLAKTMADEPDAEPLSRLAQQTAAMALGASQDPRAHDALLDALEQNARVAAVAERALLAYPPSSFTAVSKRTRVSATLCAVLGRMGDLRAIPLLRGALVRSAAAAAPEGTSESHAPSAEDQREVRVAAARALAELGDEEQVPVARSWATSESAEVRLAGLQILLASHAKDGTRELVAALRVPELRGRALHLGASARASAVELAPVLGAIAGEDEVVGHTATSWLGWLDSGAGVAALDRLLRDPSRAWDAAFALSMTPGSAAAGVLQRALGEPSLRRLAARASIVRSVSTGDVVRGLVAQLEQLERSVDPADRATGAFGLGLLGEVPARRVSELRDLPVVRALARAAIVRGGALARACSERLSRETDPRTRQSLAVVLALGSAFSAGVSTGDLAAWADGDEPQAPLAAFALGAREQAFGEERMDVLLASRDPVIRAHAAWGLAESPSSNVSARLAHALRFEADPSVRRALVQALSTRGEPQRLSALRDAARLDPDARVRELARGGLRAPGQLVINTLGAGCVGGPSAASSCTSAWIRLLPGGSAAASTIAAPGPARSWTGERAATFHEASGWALPVVSDPDGVLVLVGVSPGVGSFDLASSALWYDAHQDDTARPPGRRKPF